MKKTLLFTLILISTSLISAATCSANSAEPPSVLIIVPNAPQDLEMSLLPENVKATRTNKVNESYYTFYRRDLKSVYYMVQIATGNEKYSLALTSPLDSYNNIFTLDLAHRTLTPGKALSRSLTLLSLRIILTLLVEGIVFYLFGYRKKKSWAIFLIVNLITQGFLYVWLNQISSPLDNYIVFTLIGGEFLVFVIEMIALLAFIDEHRRARTAIYVVVANLLSLLAGGYLITVLPV